MDTDTNNIKINLTAFQSIIGLKMDSNIEFSRPFSFELQCEGTSNLLLSTLKC